MKWYVRKEAAENPSAPQPTPTPPAPQATPTPQQPQPQRTIFDVSDPRLEVKRQRERIEAFKASPEGKEMLKFILLNRTETHADPNRIEQYKSNQTTWKAFQELATEALGKNESFGQFLERITHVQRDIGVLEGEDKPVEDTNEQAGDVSDKTAEDQAARPFLEQLASDFLERHGDWIESLSSQFPSIGSAPFNFFTGNAKGGTKKWKKFLVEHPHLLPPKIKQMFARHINRDILQMINRDIAEAQAKYDEPSSILALKQVVEADGGPDQDALKEAIMQASRALDSYKGGMGNSLNKNLGGPGSGQALDLVADQSAIPADKIEEAIPDAQLNQANRVFDAMFSPANASFIEQCKQLQEEDSHESFYTALMESGHDANDILREGVNDAIKGFSSSNGKAKWQIFFDQNPDLLPQGVEANKESLNQNSEAALGVMAQLAQAGDQRVQQFVLKGVQRMFDDKFMTFGLENKAKLKDILPIVGNIKNIDKLGRIVYGYLSRDYEISKARGMKTYPTAGRRLALIKCKVEELMKDFHTLTKTNTPVQLSAVTRVYRNDRNNLILQRKSKSKANKGGWDETALKEEDFPVLTALASPQVWVPKAMDLMIGKLKDPSLIARPQKDKRQTQYSPEIVNLLDQATDAHISSGDTQDRLSGYRKAMGQLIATKRQQLSQQLGHEVSHEELAKIVRSINMNDDDTPEGAVKKGRKPGNRIQGDEVDTADYIRKLETGEPTPYSEKDLDILAKALKAPLHSFYAPAKEYDKYNFDDITNLGGLIAQSFRAYGPYLIHRKREAVRRGINESVFNKRTMYYFLSLMGVHSQFSRKQDPSVGRFLYQLTNRPVGVGDSAQEVTDTIKGAPLPDMYGNDYVYPHPRMPDRGSAKPGWIPRYEMNPEQVGLPDDLENPEADPWKDPNQNVSRTYVKPAFDEMTKHTLTPEKDLAHYHAETLKDLTHKSMSQMPENLERMLQSNMPRVNLAKDIIKEIWNNGKTPEKRIDEQHAMQMLQHKWQRANRFNAKHGLPESSIEDFADKYCQDELKMLRYFREQAKERLNNIQANYKNMTPDEKFNAVVPASVRRRMPLHKMELQDVRGPGGNKRVDMQKQQSSLLGIFLTAMDTLSKLERLGSHKDVNRVADLAIRRMRHG